MMRERAMVNTRRLMKDSGEGGVEKVVEGGDLRNRLLLLLLLYER